ncbi:queuosine precursor transporter [Brachyspira pilosicoli]|uniref:Queuosine precursor transporter n=1 Tax=Brachyspira pilosicoli TaxID=52584 RepID=A0A5C8EQX7_BRAPL|nr:queuosine precursor transporter [Brachyspira pilosicoli]TXJ39381.1 VUT family protein [Brachyspira pilosicoli]
MEKNYEYQISFISIIIIGSYIACQMISNIASVKIANVLNLAVDGGTFLYPLAFTIRDMSHKTIGKKNTQKLILVSAIINIFTPIYFYIISNIPADSSWQFNEAFQLTLSPVLRISIASIVGSTVAELVDTEIYHFFVTKITKRYQWLRVLISNAFSIPVDNLLFVVIAFYGALPFEALVGIFVFNFFVKYAVTIISVPMIYLVKENKE